MSTVAILPVKSFRAAKSRLAGALSGEKRALLAQAMLEDVLAVLERSQALDGLVVVTDEPHAARAGAQAGAMVVSEGASTTHSQAAAVGVEAAIGLGASRVLLVPADCPVLIQAEIESLLAAVPVSPAVGIVADRHGSGTNALVLDPPEVIAPSFGPGSRARHEEAAAAARAHHDVVRVPGLELDVDTPDDLAAVRTALRGRTGSRTLAVLAELPDAHGLPVR